jgi:hypothetical protein
VKRSSLKIWTIAVGALVVIGAAAMAAVMLSSIFGMTRNREELVNGEIIYAERTRTYEIYLQDNAPPTMRSFDFMFFDIESGRMVVSYAPVGSYTYSLNTLIVNGVHVRGDYGRLVALVDLEAGNYTVVHAPYSGPGIFIWGVNMMETMPFGLFLKVLPIAIMVFLLGVLFVVLIVRLVK